MFLQHLDTELSEDDVQKITSGSKAKAQITVLTAQVDKIYQFFFSSCFTVCLLYYLCFSPQLVAQTGHFTLHQSPGKVWIHRPAERHKPPSFPQTFGGSLEGSEPDLQP